MFFFSSDGIVLTDVHKNKVLLVTTDAASYMISAMEALTVLYPKMLHVTCAAHGLHRVAELVRTKFKAVNALISNVKRTFTKVKLRIFGFRLFWYFIIPFYKQSPRRKLLFKTLFPDTPMPPRPIITRWGTWIDAAIYFATNFEKVERFFNELDPKDDAKCVRKAKAAICQANIKNDLTFIKSHFACLPVAITKLEEKGTLLSEAIEKFKSVRTNLAAIPRRKEFQAKFDSVHGKNSGLQTLEKIARIIDGDNLAETDDYIKALSPADLSAFKYAPITSCDVERSFSAYNRVLEDCRRAFVFENLKKHVIIHCNKFD